jgi:uncharacterized protein YcaQ
LLKISLDAARKLAIHAQHLGEPKHSSLGKAQIFKLVQGLSYLQIDPISAVAPSQRIVLWSRLGNFKLADFDSLMWKERKLFEYYAHAASIVLTEDYPIHEARMRAYVNGHGIPKSWHVIIQTWMKRNNVLRLYVLKELKRRGPLASREIEDLSAKPWRSSGWTNQRNVDRMLHFLQAQGKIIVSGRSGNQKLWDLSERFLPSWTPRTILTDYEIDRIAMQKSLRALGLATQKQIMEHFSSGRYSNPSSVLEDLESEGIISEVELDGIRNGKKWYVHSKDPRPWIKYSRESWRVLALPPRRCFLLLTI